MTDYYQTLGVNRDANPEEIKRAYRSLASKHHPDKGGDTNKFQEIQVAYDTLSDPNKRAQYDNPQPQGFPGGFHFHHGGMGGGFDDILSQMFGGSPFGFSGRQPQRNRTLSVQASVTLEEAFNGKDLIATLGLPSGREQTIEVRIPAGINDGVTLRLAGMGDDSMSNMPRGDIHLTVNVLPHEKFNRQGDDLHYSLQINCIDAILGKSTQVTTIEGKTLELNIPPGTQHGAMLSAAGHGMPMMNDNRFRGRMIINVEIVVPKFITDEQKAILIQHFQ